MSEIIIPRAKVISPNRVYRESDESNVVYIISKYTVPSVEDTVNYLRDLLQRKRELIGGLDTSEFDVDQLGLLALQDDEDCDEKDGCLLQILETLPRNAQSLFLKKPALANRYFPGDMGVSGCSYLEIKGGSLEPEDINLFVENGDYESLEELESLIDGEGGDLWNIRFRLDKNRFRLRRGSLGLYLAASEGCSDNLVIDDTEVDYDILVKRTMRFYDALRGKIGLVEDVSYWAEYSCRLKTANEFLDDVTVRERSEPKEFFIGGYSFSAN